MPVLESMLGVKPEGAYQPGPVEARARKLWRDLDLFRADATSNRPPFTIMIPPPNVTGSLTIGHCLNNTLQDVIIRHRRMSGYEALWLPGTDHAGIATQNVVERKLLAEGKTRHDLGREAFVAEVWRFKEEQQGRIRAQLDALGCSCDWSRERFTLDPGLSRAVRKAFVTLYVKGLIYRGDYIVNWCPRCQTALSDEEVDRNDEQGTLTTIRYPLKDAEGSVTVATTRPETMLGDVAVAVHPEDDRYRHLVGKKAVLPLLGREIPIIADASVDPTFGTGAVKVTPAHDPNDFLIGERHALTPIVVMAGDGTMNENAGPFAGLDRFVARERIVSELKSQGLIADVREHMIPLGRCQRCGTVVEPMLSRQWFVRMRPLADPALAAVTSERVRFQPERWVGVYRHWMENIRDWCISRQLWWGHRIPAWTCAGCGELLVAEDDPPRCPKCGGALHQDEDVLDTWFSSWLWPFSTLGWPERTRDLEKFYPTQFLSTGPDIIFFWVARMIAAGIEFTGKVPFDNVNFHAIVRDPEGRKMSKSLGNSPDPLDVIAAGGADALRFTLMLLTPPGQDLYFAAERIETGRHFANKLWNAAKLVIGALEGVEAGAGLADDASLQLEDRWIRSRLAAARDEVEAALTAYRAQDAAKAIYEFVWHEFCDWYLELIKGRLYGGDAIGRNTARLVAYEVMEISLRLLHPIMPFVTEDLWQRLPHQGESIAGAPWPAPMERNREAEDEMGFLMDVVVAVRNIRSEMNVPPGREAEVIARASGREAALLERGRGVLASLGRARLKVSSTAARPPAAATGLARETELFVPLAGLIDLEVERRRLRRDLEKAERELDGARRRLAAPAFLAKAPPAVVNRENERLSELEATQVKLTRLLESLDQPS